MSKTIWPATSRRGIPRRGPSESDRRVMAVKRAEITSHDVARLAGVSQPTVSPGPSRGSAGHKRPGNGSGGPPPRPTTCRTRWAAISRPAAPASRHGRGSSIPAVPPADGPGARGPRQRGYRMMLFAENGDADQASVYDRLFDQSIDGVILTTTRMSSTLPAALARRGIPYVMLNRTLPGADASSCVADNVGGAGQVAGRFLRGGRRRIAAILGPEQTSTAREREQGSARLWRTPTLHYLSATSVADGSTTRPATPECGS